MSDRMLPKLNRNTSMVINNGPSHLLNNSLNGPSEDGSPLKLFSRAKNTINSIYYELKTFIGEVNSFLDSQDLSKSKVLDEKEIQSLKAYQDKSDGLIKMISRDRMKVVFFGRTSNGKSTAINAMLKDKILPTGIGHTTNCFLQVEGSDSLEQPCIYIPGSETPLSVQNLSQLGNALSDERLDSSSLVRVLWPKEKCRLLKEDVVLVDSPGIDVSSDLDSWINQQCLDADVFILVVNAESTLTKTEKEFFIKVRERLTKPNVFILNNRWDATAYEPETAEVVKAQHTQRNTEFLCTELKVCDPQEVNNRIYFVSAREALLTRTQTNPQLPPGFQSRLLSFEWFEAEFEKCISMSAVKTKFDQPAKEGIEMASHLRKTLDFSNQRASDYKLTNEENLKKVTKKIEIIEKRLQEFTQDVKDKIRHLMEDVEKNVSIALNDEIKRIYYLIDQYERPFHPEEHQLNWYKKELHTFVEQKLGSNLASRLNIALAQMLDLTQRDIRSRVLELVVSEENRKLVATNLPRSDFAINFCLDCTNLCSDFKEDIAFQFSLGFTALMKRFTGRKSLFDAKYSNNNAASMTAKLFSSTTNLFNPSQSEEQLNSADRNSYRYKEMYASKSSSSAMVANNSNLNAFASNEQSNNLLVLLQGIQLVTSKSNVVLIVVGGVVWRGLGWKILAITGSLYGLAYLYERLMWTRKTQEKLFKKQYADYASSKLRLIVDLTGQNAAYQVQREVSQYFAQMCRYIDITKDEYFDELKKYEQDIKMYSNLINQTKILRNKSKYIQDDFENFNNDFLQKIANS